MTKDFDRKKGRLRRGHGASKIVIQPLEPFGRSLRVYEIVSRVTVREIRQSHWALRENLEVKSLVTDQRGEKGFIAEYRLLRQREEFAPLFCVWPRFLRIERVKPDESHFLWKQTTNKLQAMPFVDRQIELRERVE